MKNILVTGGAGFIGSHLIKHFLNKYKYKIINLDKLTYAGNLNNLTDVENNKNYEFIKGDITDYKFVNKIFNDYNINNVIHLAAESHVDRSINDPFVFAKTNFLGTLTLLEASKKKWNNKFSDSIFYHVSTDEVYGSLSNKGFFSEKTPYDPRSPYSASKASSDHLVRSFYHTYKLPIIISNCSNNYGPFQFSEKLIPLVINSILEKQMIPVYGDGKNIRDWLYVQDHILAIDKIFHNAKSPNTYNIGGNTELENIEIIKILVKKIDKVLGNKEGDSLKLIKFVEDRKGHDFRYAIDSTKLMNDLNWAPKTNFNDGIDSTIKWYIENFDWVKNIKDGSYINKSVS